MKSIVMLPGTTTIAFGSLAADSPAVAKTGHFDRDPGWEGHNNHIVPKQALTVNVLEHTTGKPRTA